MAAFPLGAPPGFAPAFPGMPTATPQPTPVAFVAPSAPTTTGARPGDELVPTQVRRDRGALLLREDTATLAARKRSYARIGAVMAAVGGACIGLMAAAAVYAWPLGYFGWLMLAMFAILFTLMGGALVFASSRLGAVAIYENGIAVPGNVGKGEFFFPWGMISNVAEQQNSIDGAYYYLTAKDGTPIGLKRSIPGLEGLMPMIRDRVGRAEYAGEIEKPKMDSFQGRLGYAMVAIVLGLSFGVGGFVGYSFADTFGSAGALLLGLGLIAPLTSMIMLPYITKRLGDMAKKQNASRGPPAGATFGSLAVCAIIFFASATQAHGIMAGPQDYPRALLPEPVGVALPSDTMDNFTLSLGGFVVAKAGRTITLTNGTLRFASVSGVRSSGLYVSKGGSLVMRNVTVEPDGAEGWTAQVFGKAVISDSRLRSPYGDKERDNEFGGLEIYSDDVRVERTRFENGASNLVFVADASPVITSNYFTGAKADAAQ
ncbi:MAG: right-handed parallel beta-helix repeat-containing protein, partial [Candidatus Rokuibacteriota bacterium]